MSRQQHNADVRNHLANPLLQFDAAQTRHSQVNDRAHLYEEGIAAGSDLAPVIVELDLTCAKQKLGGKGNRECQQEACLCPMGIG
jgi:hypothetical protein